MNIFRLILRLLLPRAPRRKKLYRPATRSVRRVEVTSLIPQTNAGPSRVVTSIVTVETIKGRCYVVDGDTITIGKTNIRLAGIDAPEMDQPYGNTAKWALFKLCNGQEVCAEFADHLSYERQVATCRLSDGRDLSAEMVKLGLALDWRKFSGGKYRHLEPADVRRKLWRVAAKHKGQMPPPTVS
jgi:micrococcal nuclease